MVSYIAKITNHKIVIAQFLIIEFKIISPHISPPHNHIKNLFISYKLRDTKRTFYPSSLCSNFEVVKGNIDNNISYSEVYNKIKLTKSIDDYIKYGYKNDNFSVLYNNFKVNYNSFDNRYKKIN